MPGVTAADRKLATAISTKLEAIDTKLAAGAMTDAPIATTTEVQQVVRELDRPEYSRFFANNPNAAKAFEEMKASTATVASTTSRVESAQLGLGGIRRAEVFQQNVDGLAAMSREMQTTLPVTEATQPVAKALQGIDSDLASIRTGAKPENVFRNVQAPHRNNRKRRCHQSGQGSETEPRRSGNDKYHPAAHTPHRVDCCNRSRRRRQSRVAISQTLTTICRRSSHGSVDHKYIAQQCSSIGAIAINQPSGKLLDTGEAGTAAVTKIKDAWAKVEDLTAGTKLSADQMTAMQEHALLRIEDRSGFGRSQRAAHTGNQVCANRHQDSSGRKYYRRSVPGRQSYRARRCASASRAKTGQY